MNVIKAELIEANLDDVTQVIDIIRSALSNRFSCFWGVNWKRFSCSMNFCFSIFLPNLIPLPKPGLVAVGIFGQRRAKKWKPHCFDHSSSQTGH